MSKDTFKFFLVGSIVCAITMTIVWYIIKHELTLNGIFAGVIWFLMGLLIDKLMRKK